jgi:membrane protease YdiL (CAAX protease family)
MRSEHLQRVTRRAERGAPEPNGDRVAGIREWVPAYASGLGTFALAAISFSVIITWVFNHTRGSLPVAILLHTAINFSQGLTSDLFPAAGFNEVGPVVAFGLTALVIVVATLGRLGYAIPFARRNGAAN